MQGGASSTIGAMQNHPLPRHSSHQSSPVCLHGLEILLPKILDMHTSYYQPSGPQ
jgi:hypothetical protein